MNQQELQAMIEATRKKLALNTAVVSPIIAESMPQTIKEVVKQHTQFDTSASDWQWNPEQLDGIAKARKRESFNLIGAAGTGKTTTTKEIVRILVSENLVPMMSMDTKYLQKGKPGIVLTSFTRRAVRNLRRAVSGDVAAHCVTLHKLLEFEPQFYEVWDETAQKMRNTMRFEPARNRNNRLPSTLKTIIIDESSMVSVDLFLKLLEALPDPKAVQFIFIGDLYQLPPVYGQAILGFKLLELKTVELTRIYRQATKSPIISLAHRIKNGEDVAFDKNEVVKNEQGMVTYRGWKKPLSDFDGVHAAGLFLKELVTKGDYDEEENIILCPQEKVKNLAFGTNEFNRIIAQALGDKRSVVVFEVVAGYEKHYYAVGDRLLVGREDAIITNITRNAKFFGKRPRPASKELDRWGSYRKKVTETVADDEMDVDAILESFTLAPTDKDEDRKQEASHMVEVELLDSGAKEVLSTAGELNATQFAYCLTVHKSQGSEWSRVFFLTHQSHVVMWSRELLYTAITRARNSLYLIIEPDRPGRRGTLWKAAKSPRIKGDTLAEKAEYFKGKQDDYDAKVQKTEGLPWQEGTKGQFKGETVKEVPKVAAPVAPPVPLIKLHEFVSATFKAEANRKLLEFWRKAESIWGTKIGPIPMMEYNLQRGKVVGVAQLQSHRILLNPLWCILAEENEKIKHEMLVETIGHEVAHLVAWHYSNDRGHNSGWVMAMQLLGLKPDVYVQDDALPSWAKSFQEVAIKKLEELKTQKNADTTDETPLVKNTQEEV